MFKRILLIITALILASGFVYAQDFGFGFGFADEGNENNEPGTGSFSPISSGFGNSLSVSIGGEVSAAIIGYFDEMKEAAKKNNAVEINTRDMFMFSGKLNFLANSSFAQGVINLKLIPALVPVSIDEAYLKAFFGGFEISAGLKKLAWGKADQAGPLDVINMPDATKIFVEMADSQSLMNIKLATPMIHASYRFGMFSKIEGVFLPNFEITSMAVSSLFSDAGPMLSLVTAPPSIRWIPKQMESLLPMKFETTETSGLDYAQAGFRFTTSIASADVGLQYFYGRMFQPAVRFYLSDSFEPSFRFFYNTFHQAGIDYAQVIFGFNIRLEFAANITEDLKGNNGFIYNPSLNWSFGFDRDILAGFNANFQANQSIRLFDDKVRGGKEPFNYMNYYGMEIPSGLSSDYDIEAGKSLTSTRLTAMLSYKFLRDELELRAAVVWGIEDKDAAIMPSLIWSRDDFRAALSGGFFAGDSKGQLGQYKDNNFLKLSIAYMF
ncbi:MAG: hypothetical protein FWC21_02500 [Treponema sp.]|nr:hypothetical protein [Treponema sp.]